MELLLRPITYACVAVVLVIDAIGLVAIGYIVASNVRRLLGV